MGKYIRDIRQKESYCSLHNSTYTKQKEGKFNFGDGRETKESLVPDNMIAYIKKQKKIYTHTIRTH